MNVLLTGGTGRVGIACVKRLVRSGHKVTVIGRRAEMEVPAGASYEMCDINDYERLRAAMGGHEAIVHLAAIASPVGSPGREVFRVNDLGTFNVFEAAAETGISRVVGASSINAFGFFYGDRGFPIRYLPVDEAHEGLATDAYSFSKQVMESIGRYFWERDRISSVMLRLPGVVAAEVFDGLWDKGAEFRSHAHQIIDLPDGERREEVARLSAAYDRWRRENRWDTFDRETGWKNALESDHNGLTRAEYRLMSSRANFFTYVHEDDSAQAIEKGLTAEYEGSHSLYINLHRNTLGRSVAEVAKLFDEPIPEVRPSAQGDNTIVSIDRARELIGFEPEFAGKG